MHRQTLILALALTASLAAGEIDQLAGGGGEGRTGAKAPTPTDPALIGAKYLDPKIPIEERVNDLLERLTREEKVALVHGNSCSEYGNIPRIGLPETRMNDSIHGIHSSKGSASAFPCGLAMAATWNPALLERMGTVLGAECVALNRQVLLGPGVNIMRTPLGGRNFEYMGEDPFLAGKMAAACVRGLQSQGVAACVKHWNLNEQEHWRTTINVECDDRALREIYAPAFEIAVREGHVWSVMPAYNRFRGDFCAASKVLNLELLRKQFGFDGAIISDWGAWHDDKLCIEGGCTIEMPSRKDPARDALIAGRVAKGEIAPAMLDEAVRRNLRLMFRVGAFEAPKAGALKTPEHQRIARQVAADGIVLLKNDAQLLPLAASTIRKIAVIGPNAAQCHTMVDGRWLGYRGGSGATRPPYEITPLAALQQRFGDKVIYAPGIQFDVVKDWSAPAHLTMSDDSMAAAVAAAKEADVALFFAGTDHRYDREALGWGDVPAADKPDLELIGPQAELIRRVVAANPKTIVVLINGAPVSVESWHASVPAIVEAWYGGQEVGNAIADILLGEANPSGKLPCTFGKQLEDWLCHKLGKESYPGTGNNGVVKYLDGIWVGYRHFDNAKIEPRFPFGHGLSYTTFKYGRAKVSVRTMIGDEPLIVTVPVTNTGKRDGAEVVQLYIADLESSVPRPPQELKGFQKLFLKAGETQLATFTITPRDLSFWDETTKGWIAEPGKFEARIGASSRDIRSKVVFKKKI